MPVMILYVSIRSPLRRLSSRVVSPSLILLVCLHSYSSSVQKPVWLLVAELSPDIQCLLSYTCPGHDPVTEIPVTFWISLSLRPNGSTMIFIIVLHRFFDDKVAGVRAATAGAAAPQFTAAPVGCELHVFSPVTPDDVAAIVRTLLDKQCSSDPLPTRLLKANVDILAPFLSHLFCLSLQHGVVPSRMKSAYITPILKKADMDSLDAKSYRPISNLSVYCPSCLNDLFLSNL